ncbi:hypothetical protein DID88_009819 [Monilinia fructigena]|uniref:O-methyltransferase domain-containing protein n=1 Tax=Monilinia fructigena TaxID=38457 RepID=A0A395IMU9_9HELO|nr:hypothetical protein DID88_009819 [Monilinia fructigena]
MDTLITQVKQVAENAGEVIYQQLIDQLREFTHCLESDHHDIMQRLIYRQMETVMIRVGEDLKLEAGFWLLYQDIFDSNDICWHSTNQTDEQLFSWVRRHPDVAANFGKWMAQYMQGQKTCLDTFPLEKEVGGWRPTIGEDVPLVNFGGKDSPLLDGLRAKVAGIEGRIILQELPKDSNLRSGQNQPHDANAAAEKPAAENTFHAKFYYIRSVFHDFQDDKCRSILSNILPTMGK